MAVVGMDNNEPVRLNDLDWKILEIMGDRRRYTPAHLYNDVEELGEHGDDWIRRRVMELHDNGLIERVGTSSMYVISNWGIAALELQEEGKIDEDDTPKELTQKLIERAQDLED